MASDIEDIDSYAQQVRTWTLGELVDELISFRLEGLQDEEESATDASKRTLMIDVLKKEISHRETGREEGDSSPSSGVSTLGGMFD